MKQEAFEQEHRETWKKFGAWIKLLSSDKKLLRSNDELGVMLGSQFPAVYRKICHHLAIARTRQYSTALQEELNDLALEGHQYLYQSRASMLGSIGRFLTFEFPQAIRKYWRYVLASTAIFYLPAIAMAIALFFKPDLIYSLVSPADVASMEQMYDPANSVLGRERESETDAMMFGYYIYNNITIGFQTFAGGLLFGIGTLFYLIFNGLFLGSVASHLTSIGYVETFWGFVAGHSSFELTAITIFGAVGLMIGHSAIAPGRRKRWQAIRDQASNGLPLIYGGGLMLLIAAFVEAFWSSTTWPPVWIKYSVGIALWIGLAAYFVFLGRRDDTRT